MAPPVIDPEVWLQTRYESVFGALGHTARFNPPDVPHPVIADGLPVNPGATREVVSTPVCVTVAGVVEPADPKQVLAGMANDAMEIVTLGIALPPPGHPTDACRFPTASVHTGVAAATLQGSATGSLVPAALPFVPATVCGTIGVEMPFWLYQSP